MPHSSLGFHTMTLSLFLLKQETNQLKQDFAKYSQETGGIQMYSNNYGNEVIKFFPDYKGIHWLIQHNVWLNGFESFLDIINVTINPKFLAGTPDYITASTYDDMDAAIANFNLISKRISPLLSTFDNYKISRLDYCINFDLAELAPECDPKLIMDLIKRADIPLHYEEWKEYDEKAHRKISRDSSFYLTSDSIHINCYLKKVQLQELIRKNQFKGCSPILSEALNAAQHIIRFEVQCKYLKIYNLSKKTEKFGNTAYNKYESLLTHEICADIIEDYFKKTIGMGNWYTLQAAIRQVEYCGFNRQKEKRLIDALRLVNERRSLAKVKTELKGEELQNFKKTLRDLSCLDINPVTIPKEWGIKYIPNLLNTYYNKVYEESHQQQIEKFQMECFEEYVKKYGCLPK